MKRLSLGGALLAILFSCAPQAPSPSIVPRPMVGAPLRGGSEPVESPQIPVASQWKVLQAVSANLDQDAAEEQLLLLQDKANLSLPITLQVADYDEARKTYYLAWDGRVLSSASQVVTLSFEDLIGDHQQELLIQGLDESGKPALDIFRLVPPSGNLGFAYKSIFSRQAAGTIRVEHPVRPESYAAGQNSDLSATVVVEESDSGSTDPRDMVRTVYAWLFQKGEYVAGATEKFRKNTVGNAVLEELFAADNPAIEAFLHGPWMKTIPDKSGIQILFLNPQSKEITFASSRAQEVYQWEATSRSGRASVYIVGSNEFINLIKLQMSLTITGADTIEVTAQDNPVWSGAYQKLEDSAARTLAQRGSAALKQLIPPSGLYRNDKGDEFDFAAPEVRMKLAGVSIVGSVAVFTLGEETILQIKAAPRPGFAGMSKAYSIVAKEESNTSRVVRTLRLQSGVLNSKGWVSDQSDPIRLEQVEGTSAGTR